MEAPAGNAFVLWIDRTHDGDLAGVVEHIALSHRRRFENVEELGRLLAEAVDDSRDGDVKPGNARHKTTPRSAVEE